MTEPGGSFIQRVRDLYAHERVPAPRDPFDPARAYSTGRGVGYAAAALEAEVSRVASAVEHTRNDTLNIAAFSLGQLVAGGELDEATVTHELTVAARSAGLAESEIGQTIASGLRAGAMSPRTVPPRDLATAPLHVLAAELPTPAVRENAPAPSPGVAELTTRLVDAERARREARRLVDAEERESLSAWPNRAVDGASFALDLPATTPAIWGEGDEVLWAQGEALIIAGGQGSGKTTLAGQLVMARLGLIKTVLGFPVVPGARRVLYLAMDRPMQAARSLARVVRPEWRECLAGHLVVWKGPPPHDFAARPETLAEMCDRFDADTVFIDSIKDSAVGIAKDEVGAAYNRARQIAISAGVEVEELHHQVKTGQGGGKPTGINDVYGSVWITSGAGSVLLLVGDPGDPVVEMRHLKQPAETVGPLDIRHDHATGMSSVVYGLDLVDLARFQPRGLTVRAASAAMFGGDEPTKAQIERARRRLDRLTRDGALRCVESATPGGTATYFRSSGPEETSFYG